LRALAALVASSRRQARDLKHALRGSAKVDAEGPPQEGGIGNLLFDKRQRT
jgi:hypothetical protein